MNTSFENSVLAHADVPAQGFWTAAIAGWLPLARLHRDETGDVGQQEFYQEMVDNADWLCDELDIIDMIDDGTPVAA